MHVIRGVDVLTMLLYYRCAANTLEMKCVHRRGKHERAIKRPESGGKFFTARLAAYPADLCVDMAQVIARAIAGMPQIGLALFSGFPAVFYGVSGQLIATFIVKIPIMALNPFPFDLVPSA